MLPTVSDTPQQKARYGAVCRASGCAALQAQVLMTCWFAAGEWPPRHEGQSCRLNCLFIKCARTHPAAPAAGADLKTIGAALAPAKELKWLVLRTAGVVGDLSCDIILPTLSLLSLTRNGITVSPPAQCTQRL